eukprot:3747842-Rhodomonas_salina.2
MEHAQCVPVREPEGWRQAEPSDGQSKRRLRHRPDASSSWRSREHASVERKVCAACDNNVVFVLSPTLRLTSVFCS